MQLLDQLRAERRPLAEIRTRVRQIGADVLSDSATIREPNFQVIHSGDLELLFDAYDDRFYNGQIRHTLKQSGIPLTFRISRRMTRVGGTTTRFRDTRRGGRISYEIAISSTLLFSTFHDVSRPIMVTGIECRDRLECLQRIFEHELIHLTEMMLWGDSSCSRQRFQSLAFQVFAHTEATHQLVTPGERALSRFGIRPGDRVRFRIDGAEYEGMVNRITRRATVLVEDSSSPMYSDGHRYARYYIPLAMLERVR